MRVYPVSKILSAKKKIETSEKLVDYLYTELTGEWFDSFVRSLCKLLPGHPPVNAVRDSCTYLAGQQLLPKMLSKVAWRLVGNNWRLRNGHAVLPWDGSPKEEWVPVQIVEAKFFVSKRGKQGAKLRLRVLAGLPCGEIIETFWSTNYCHTFARYMGFSRFSNGPKPFVDVRQLVSLRLYVLVEPGSAEIRFEKMSFPASCRSWNVDYIKRRTRVEFKCPKNYPDEVLCHLCPIGIDQCPVAVHSRTYLRGNCVQCHSATWMETAESTICVNCNQINILKQQGDQT